jgi:endoglucanase Acf2
VVGILWDNGQDYQTYFGLNPIYIHGIQWLPLSPGSVYLAQNPTFAQQQYNNMLAEQLVSQGSNSISSMGAQWGNYALWYALQFNPDYVAAQMDQLYAVSDPVATDPTYAGTTYYFTHAYRKLGAIQWGQHLSVPTSAVYYNTNSGQYTYVAYNPKSTPQVAILYSNSVAVGTVTLPAFSLVSSNLLTGNGGSVPLAVVSSVPAANQTGVPATQSQVSMNFNQNVSAVSATSATLTGANVTGLAYSQGDGTAQLVFNILGSLQPSQSYTVTIPATVTTAGGTNTLGTNYSFSFTVAPPAPAPVVVPATVERGVAIRWPTLAQSNYILQRAVCLATNSGWTNLLPLVVGDGKTNTFYDPLDTNIQRFYRVLQMP